MHSWVRYSVSAYLGLLLAGSIANPGPGASPASTPVASLRESQDHTKYYLVPSYPSPKAQPAIPADSAES